MAVNLITGTSPVVTVPPTGIVDTGTLGLAVSPSLAGTYTNPILTANSNGLITAITSGTTPTVSSVAWNGGVKQSFRVAINQTNYDWNATSGYGQILNKPSPTQAVNADWNVTDTSSPAYIKNKPSLGGSIGLATFNIFSDTTIFIGTSWPTLFNFGAEYGSLPSGWTFTQGRYLNNNTGSDKWVYLTANIIWDIAGNTNNTNIIRIVTGTNAHTVEGITSDHQIYSNLQYVYQSCSALAYLTNGNILSVQAYLTGSNACVMKANSHLTMVFLN